MLSLCSCVASVLIHCFSLSVYWLELLGIVEHCFDIVIALLSLCLELVTRGAWGYSGLLGVAWGSLGVVRVALLCFP